MDDTRKRVQQVFGEFAQNYVTSTVHGNSYSLDRLIELVAPAPGQTALDVATGGGHVARAIASAGATVISSDLTPLMLRAARGFIQEQKQQATFAQVDAQHFPFVDRSLDIVTCRVAPHHFPNPAEFVQECARVLKPGGVVGLVDQVVPVEQDAAEYVNAFERLRDPSHVWAYSQKAWESFFVKAGLRVRHEEIARNRLDFEWWTKMQNNDAETVMRLRVMLKQAPELVASFLEPEVRDDGGGSFSLWQLILIAEKA